MEVGGSEPLFLDAGLNLVVFLSENSEFVLLEFELLLELGEMGVFVLERLPLNFRFRNQLFLFPLKLLLNLGDAIPPLLEKLEVLLVHLFQLGDLRLSRLHFQ